MPMGGFLDALPAGLFVVIHIILLAVGVWAAIKARRIFWLYAVSQIVFLTFFGGLFTMKMAVLLEQTLLVIMVIWITVKSRQARTSRLKLSNSCEIDTSGITDGILG